MKQLGQCYGMLHGALQQQIQHQVNMMLLNIDAASDKYWLALVHTTIPQTVGNVVTV